MATTVWKRWATRLALGLGCLIAASLATAQEDPPDRVARMSLSDAGAQWAHAGSNDWQSAEANWPLTAGDRIRLPAGSRTELHAGASALRLQGPAQLEIGALDDATLRLVLADGSLNLSVRELAANERVEVNTGNLAMVVDRPGEFRIDADPAGDTTAVGVRSGAVTVYGENGQSSPLVAPRQARYAGRQLLALDVMGLGARDGLDQWAADRMRAEEQSVSARYVSRETIGYQELDAHGEWVNDVSYGTVWYPRVTVADWAPYRYGQWRWVHPWGWTWIDDARWGFAPFHYGRWVQTGSRWGWVPGPITRRPAYAPALVGFAGTPGHRPPPGRAQAPGADWFPLAPGEAWRPPFGASQRYLDRVNRGYARPGGGQPPRYQFERRPEAVTTTPLRDMRPDDGVRSTRRERPPMVGAQLGLPAPGPGMQPGRDGRGGRDDDQDRRERWQREQQQLQQQGLQQQQQQWRRHQQSQDESNNELHQRHQQVLQEQRQREFSARQQQRQLQDQQAQQLQQLRQQQDQQQRQMQEPHRQQERFMREQQDAQQRQMQQRQQEAMRAQQEQQRRAQQPQQQAPQRPMAGDPRFRQDGRERRQDQ
ncbi:DUF6600 domain-containing protein [Pseudorhodoferax sp. Leaf267]|uniref:DUF6600 domain-containing protein n=1 Tax=Pseudorhodoferax sp. Leaf267 TaxID=1736316 RepID=UPI0006F85875|nr:DUF6600 domain-containing protein [Pseudorhodoferax sp. Leaf267]KQP22021.1 hypothetical protein ASF43_24580 [Pseudorhodoferax sp. Leaf267]